MAAPSQAELRAIAHQRMSEQAQGDPTKGLQVLSPEGDDPGAADPMSDIPPPEPGESMQQYLQRLQQLLGPQADVAVSPAPNNLQSTRDEISGEEQGFATSDPRSMMRLRQDYNSNSDPRNNAYHGRARGPQR